MQGSNENNAEQSTDTFRIVMVILIFIFLIIVAAVVYFRYKKKNKSKKLEEEINKLQQYVNSCDRKENSKCEVNTQQQILSQTNSFSKTNRMIANAQPTGKIFIEFEKSEREIINQQSPKDEEEKKQSTPEPHKKKPSGKKKNLNIELPTD